MPRDMSMNYTRAASMQNSKGKLTFHLPNSTNKPITCSRSKLMVITDLMVHNPKTTSATNGCFQEAII
jgi:hypothetical protein